MSEENQSTLEASVKEANDELTTDGNGESNVDPQSDLDSTDPKKQTTSESTTDVGPPATPSEVQDKSADDTEANADTSDVSIEPVQDPEPVAVSTDIPDDPVEDSEEESEASDRAVKSSKSSDTASEDLDPTPEATEVKPTTDSADESPSEDSSASSLRSEEVGDEPLQVGYTGEIIGDVIALSSLEEQSEATDEEKAETEELIKLIDSSLKKVSNDEIVIGRVISVGDKDVVIDIGFKSDGVISKSEFSGEVNPGDEVEVYLERMENYHGQLVLSKGRAEQVRRWEQVEQAFANGTILEGTIIRRIKGGMLVNLIDGLEAFLPGSQIDMRPVRDFDSYLDRKMQFKIVKINAENENVVVSHKALIERQLASQRESILSTMEVGQVLEGIAKNITDFGVFVDLGGVDGLLHITDLTWGRVSHPTEIVSLDQELKVVVLEYDKERQRISLGLKQLQTHPWENIDERYKSGDVVEGKVVSITDYGAFLELEQGIEGLVHVSEMSWTGHIRHPSQRVSLGQMVKVSVLSIDHDTKKISLGMKEFEVNPWEGIATRYPPGTVLRGHVRNITHFGAFVEIEPGIDGLVHVSDLSWTKTIRHPSEIIKKRQELSVVVLDVDEKRQRIALGHKQIETNPWTNLASVFETGSDHKAKVIRIERNGLTVELPLEVEGFVPGGELKNKYDSGFPPYQEGEELDLRVIRLDVSKKEIVLSETARQRQEQDQVRQKEQKAKRAERKEQEKAVRQHAQREQIASGPTTIGELSGLESIKETMENEDDQSPADSTLQKEAPTVDTLDASQEEVAEMQEVEAMEDAKSETVEVPEAETIETSEVEADEPPEATDASKAGADETPDAKTAKAADAEVVDSADSDATETPDAKTAKAVDAEVVDSADSDATETPDAKTAKAVDAEVVDSVDLDATETPDAKTAKAVDAEDSPDAEATEAPDVETAKAADAEVVNSADSDATETSDAENTATADVADASGAKKTKSSKAGSAKVSDKKKQKKKAKTTKSKASKKTEE